MGERFLVLEEAGEQYFFGLALPTDCDRHQVVPTRPDIENCPECAEVDPSRNKGPVGVQIDKTVENIVIVIIIPSMHPMIKPFKTLGIQNKLMRSDRQRASPPRDSLVLEGSMGPTEYELDGTPMFAPHFVSLWGLVGKVSITESAEP